MTKVILYGNLKEKYGESYTVHIDSANEAITALGEQLPGFYKDIYEGSWCIKRGDTFLSQEALSIGMGQEDLHIMPEVVGAKSEWIPIILGTALVLAAPQFAIAAGAEGATIGGMLAGKVAEAGIAANLSLGVGASLLLGGVSQMLFTPTLGGDPAEREAEKVRKNGIFGGQWNLSQQGQVIPIFYGQTRVGSQVGQNALRTEDFNIAQEIESQYTRDLNFTTGSTAVECRPNDSTTKGSVTMLGYQAEDPYYAIKVGGGSGSGDSPITFVSDSLGSITPGNTFNGETVFSFVERVVNIDGEQRLYVNLLFNESLSGSKVISDNFLREVQVIDSGGTKIYELNLALENDFCSYRRQDPDEDNPGYVEGYSSYVYTSKFSPTEVPTTTNQIKDLTNYIYDSDKESVTEDFIRNTLSSWGLSEERQDDVIENLNGEFNLEQTVVEDTVPFTILEWDATSILAGNPTTHQLSTDSTYTLRLEYGRPDI